MEEKLSINNFTVAVMINKSVYKGLMVKLKKEWSNPYTKERS